MPRHYADDTEKRPLEIRPASMLGRWLILQSRRSEFRSALPAGTVERVGYAVTLAPIKARRVRAPYSPSGEELRAIVARVEAEEARGMD